MKKILIFTAGFGEGHNTAARSIRDALHHVVPEEAYVEIFDLFEACYGKLNQIVRKAYITAINRTPRFWGKIYNVIDGTQVVESNMAVLSRMRRAMLELLDRYEPDVVVSTYPIYNYVLDDLYAGGYPKSFAQVTVITDSITINSVWYRCSSDYFLVANEDTAAVLRAAGCPEDRIKILGFPVTHRFAEMRDRRYTAEDVGPRKVLYMINSGKKEAPELVQRLSKQPG
ncbi:MAG: UDP-N-acetylglucosamine--LPS N-acetylglucosamine transferase, partial [Verrucomicrobia bacterium]|nr:UDP-N-acetylglucosamine--LPS N-acetylglucosamine transferase [Verrucomicrobiota bacterium]